MYKSYLALLISTVLCCFSINAQRHTGFFNFTYSDAKGTIHLEVPKDRLDVDFLYVNSLSGGIGSNDIGLDRGQLGDDRVVRFVKTGNKLLLLQPNLRYRAESPNAKERKAVEEAFAQSVLWGFEIAGEKNDTFSVDLTPFLMRDAHGVSRRLQSSNQGTYKLDKTRSALWMDRTKAFPENTEFDALLTFTGEPKGAYIRSVAPSADAVTVRQHHSFIQLPDDAYTPRTYHPYSGFNQMMYMDYATPIEESIQKRFIFRHRLEKKNPGARISEAVEPIVYYMDPGCPEPIKSALMEGAAWWDQAFQAAGYTPGTFQIKELPEGADMLDVRYNVIQWVHRSTRGWSYGSSISDPRTGEILKGHVSLGSLRVRQDFLIAQGLLSPYKNSDTNHGKMKELALARLRQLAAHEVGHTIGLSHNFASSVNNRASVMDYPHPKVEVAGDGSIDFSDAYDTGIGSWDKRAILYGYQDFPAGTSEESALQKIIGDTQKEGLRFISDSDARPAGGAHPQAHLWDNGEDAVQEFNRLLEIRKSALGRMGENSIRNGTPLSELEKILVPVYLLHRYQLEAVAKHIGGVVYDYYVKGDTYTHTVVPVDKEAQHRAVDAVLASLQPGQLVLPKTLIELIPPPAQGFRRDRETFRGKTNLVFDPVAPAGTYANTAFRFLLNTDRLARLDRQGALYPDLPGLHGVLNKVTTKVFAAPPAEAHEKGLHELVQKTYVQHLLHTLGSKGLDLQVADKVSYELHQIANKYLVDSTDPNPAHIYYLKEIIGQFRQNPRQLQLPELNDLPPGSPIGCGGDHWLN